MTPAAQFALFDRENPQVWRWFLEFTESAILAGHEHLSADMIMHRVRWETSVKTRGTFKINNNLVAFYARKYAENNPVHRDFFRFRKSRADQQELKLTGT